MVQEDIITATERNAGTPYLLPLGKEVTLSLLWIPAGTFHMGSPPTEEGQTGFEFLKEVPTTWDETRFLAGEARQFVVAARRRDRTWYLGGITNDTAREIVVPLDILGPGEYEARVFVDGSLNKDEPNAIRLERRTVTADTPLKVAMASGGGFVAAIHPKSKGNGAAAKP